MIDFTDEKARNGGEQAAGLHQQGDRGLIPEERREGATDPLPFAEVLLIFSGPSGHQMRLPVADGLLQEGEYGQSAFQSGGDSFPGKGFHITGGIPDQKNPFGGLETGAAGQQGSSLPGNGIDGLGKRETGTAEDCRGEDVQGMRLFDGGGIQGGGEVEFAVFETSEAHISRLADRHRDAAGREKGGILVKVCTGSEMGVWRDARCELREVPER